MAGDITLGRQAVKARFPYYFPILYALTLVPDRRVQTMGVTPGYVLAYNPEYVEQLGLQELEAVFWHEVQHVTDTFLLNDMGLDHALLNKAADCCINHRGRLLGLKFPPGVYFPEMFKLPPGLSTYPYYELLEKQQQANKNKKPQQGAKEGAGSTGQEQSSGGGSSSNKTSNPKSGKSGSPQPTPPEDGGGAGAGDCHVPPDLARELDAVSGKTDIQKKKVQKDFAEAVFDYVSKGRGSVPGELLEWAKVINAPAVIPWEQVLRSVLRGWVLSSLRQEDTSTYRRLHRRNFLERGARVLLPGDEAETPEVLIIIDTSGSMGGPSFSGSLRETRGVLESLGQDEVMILQADVIVHSEEMVPIHRLEAGEFEMKGRGGTSFVQPLERAKELQAKVVIYFTDGDGTLPAVPPDFQVIWAIIDGVERRMPFGETVFVK